MTRPISTRARDVLRVVMLAGVFALASAADARAEDGNVPMPTAAAAAVQESAARFCAGFGPDYVAVGTSGLCARVGGGLLVSASKEFTDRDIVMIGQRIPMLLSDNAGIPMVFYHTEDVSKQTRYPAASVIASANMMIRAQSDLGLLRGFIRVTADSRTQYDDNGDIGLDLRKIDDSYYLGALEEAWVQWNGLKLGIQPSLFGFNRLPSVVTPGYTSIVTTLAASYTHQINRNMSVSISAEDPGRRNMGDGILARPTQSDTPDIVAMMRIATPSTLFHFSGALHHTDDRVMKDFLGGEEKSVRGWAWSAGLQSRVKWDEYFGPDAKGLIGRLGLTMAGGSGALGYLGIPFFAPDYVVGGDGAVHRSTGWSALASYEHMLTPTAKLNLNASFFSVSMHSTPEEIGPAAPDMPPMPGLNFDVDVRGSVLQAGVEFMPLQGVMLGIEGGYTFTEAKGRYAGVSGEKESVGFPHVGVYLRKSF